jgi:hypothetical protein
LHTGVPTWQFAAEILESQYKKWKSLAVEPTFGTAIFQEKWHAHVATQSWSAIRTVAS